MIAFMLVRVQLGLSPVGLWLESVVGLGLAFGLVLRLGLVSGLYKWLFYLATVKQHKHVDNNTSVGLNLGVIHCERSVR